MSISSIRRAFQIGLDGRASCTYATMTYLGSGKGHRLDFKCVVGSKEERVDCECPAGLQPETMARAMGEKWGEEWAKGKAK